MQGKVCLVTDGAKGIGRSVARLLADSGARVHAWDCLTFVAFTKALGRELVEHGILVNCVAPGPIDTDMIRDLGADVVTRMIAVSPIKRLGSADEVAELVAWLASDASRFNTGAIFDMSGGRARY